MRKLMGKLTKVLVCLLAVAYMSAAVYAGRGDLWSVGDNNTDYVVVKSNGQLVAGAGASSSVAMSANTTLNTTAPQIIYLGAMTGNHTFVLPPVNVSGARAHIRLIAAVNTIGTTGNLTLSVGNDSATVGNINGINTLTVTNTSGATGAVSFIDCYADPVVSTNDWYVGVVRR